VKIDRSGKCNFCAGHEFSAFIKAQSNSDITELRRIAEELKQKKQGKYDCIIGASGGLDSSYVIYVAKKLLGLNPLVISYDHGFTYDIAENNLQTICKKLDVDFKILRSAKGNNTKHIKFLVLALRNIDVYWGFCQFCRYLRPAVIYKFALEENISATLTSRNLYEETHIASLPTNFKLKSMLQGMLKLLNIVKLVKFLFYLAIASYYFLRLKLEFYVPPVSNIFRRDPKPPKIEKINITKYIPWNIDSIVKTLTEEVGWKAPDPMLPMRFDCKIEDSFINYTYKKAVGMTCHAIICNNLIKDGTRTKNQLKETVESRDNIVSQRMEEMAVLLNLKSAPPG
jgi:hypothetical protein